MKCPNCGTENPDGAKFCNECGQELKSALPSPKPRPLPEPERKHVTALFSDLSGYTAMTEKLDPEQVKEITSRIFTGVKEIVAKYEGFIERVMGDGCLAFFGIPRAHEDDPIRAIHTALEIHDLVTKLSPQYEGRVGAPLTMHSGINTGLVVTADVNPEKGTHGVAGDAVNVASRLSSMAGPGEILVGEETVRRAKGRFVFDDLGKRQAKGKAEPITVFKVVSVAAHSGATRVDRQVSSEMVGRDRELDRLELQVMKAINGEGSVVNVIGEAGIGKSRLIAELKKREVMKRVTLLEGRAISIGKNLSFHPIIDLLKQWAGIGEADTEAVAFDKLERSIRAVHPEETSEILPFVATLMGMKLTGKHAERVKGIEGEGLEKLIFKNVRELLIKGSELRPTVVVMEDLHWADTSSIEILDALFRLAEKHRIAFLNVFRPGYFETTDGKIASIGTRIPGHYVDITIQALDKTNSETLISNMLAIKGLPYTVKNQIVERAGGNPFFIEEVVRSLIDEGAVVKRDGGFQVTDKIDHVVIPPTINDVLMARIDRLEERTRELVKVASVIGRSFFDRIIKDVAESIGDVDHRLAYLKEVQLIRDRTRMQELEYLFKHALAQEAAYESTLIQQRKALHLKVAQSIERVFQEKLREFYGMLAFHYSKGEDLEKAEEYMTKAGEEALRSSASSEALSYFQDALKLYLDKYGDAADREKLANFEKNIGLAFYNKGHFADTVKYLDGALERWGAGPPRRKLVALIRAVLDLLIVTGKLYLPSRGVKRAPDAKEGAILDLIFTRAVALNYVDTGRFFAEVVRMARKSDKLDLKGLANARKVWSATGALFSYSGLSFKLGEKCLERAERVADRNDIAEVIAYRTLVAVHNHCAGTWDRLGDYDESSVNDALRSGEFWFASTYIRFFGQVRAEQGKFVEAEELAEKWFETAEVFDHDMGRLQSHALKADLLIKTRQLHEAAREAEAGISLSRQRNLAVNQIHLMGFNLIALIMLNDADGAKKTILQADELIDKQGIVAPVFLAPYVLGRLLTDIHLLKEPIRADYPENLSQEQKRAYKSCTAAMRNSHKYAPYRTWILRLMGDYYWLVGKQRKAMKWYDRSIKEGERLGARPDLSRTYFEVGKRLLEPQSKYMQLNGIDAKGYFEKAEKLFREMGLEKDLEDLERVRMEL